MKTGAKTKIGTICAAIIGDVEAGRLKVGDKVPSLVKLMQRFDCAPARAAGRAAPHGALLRVRLGCH